MLLINNFSSNLVALCRFIFVYILGGSRVKEGIKVQKAEDVRIEMSLLSVKTPKVPLASLYLPIKERLS